MHEHGVNDVTFSEDEKLVATVGNVVDKQTFATYLTPSDAKKLLDPETTPLCFTIKAENVLGEPELFEE